MILIGEPLDVASEARTKTVNELLLIKTAIGEKTSLFPIMNAKSI